MSHLQPEVVAGLVQMAKERLARPDGSEAVAVEYALNNYAAFPGDVSPGIHGEPERRRVEATIREALRAEVQRPRRASPPTPPLSRRQRLAAEKRRANGYLPDPD